MVIQKKKQPRKSLGSTASKPQQKTIQKLMLTMKMRLKNSKMGTKLAQIDRATAAMSRHQERCAILQPEPEEELMGGLMMFC